MTVTLSAPNVSHHMKKMCSLWLALRLPGSRRTSHYLAAHHDEDQTGHTRACAERTPQPGEERHGRIIDAPDAQLRQRFLHRTSAFAADHTAPHAYLEIRDVRQLVVPPRLAHRHRRRREPAVEDVVEVLGDDPRPARRARGEPEFAGGEVFGDGGRDGGLGTLEGRDEVGGEMARPKALVVPGAAAA